MQPSIKIAQPGWNANTAPDWALIYSSQWPSLAIAYETTIDTAKTIPTVKHNLGFPPLTMMWQTVNNVCYGRSFPEVTKTEVFPGLLGANTGIYTIRCFNVDVSKDASYPLPQSASAKLVSDLTTSIKFVRGTRSINSKNLNDFILNSQAQSPAVLNVATEKSQYFLQSNERHYWPYGSIKTWDLIVYPLQTSYIPWYIGCQGLGSDFYQQEAGQAVYYDSTTHSLVLNISSTGSGSLIILRDPLFYPNTVRVVY
jgi:hypothetical protein